MTEGEAVKRPGKTGKKSGTHGRYAPVRSPKGGAPITPGAHPGNTGGKKGRSGRKPMAFKVLAHDILHDPKTQQKLRAAAQDPDTPGYSSLVLGLAKYSEGLEGMVSLETLNRWLEAFGLVLARHIKEPDVLAAIQADAGPLQAILR